GRTVADRPIRWAGRSRRASRRSRDRARCAPRLVPATACTSSTMTVSTPRSDSRAREVRIRNSDSGVVIRMSGGLTASLRRSSAGVSPDRIPTRTSGSGRPRRRAACRMPVSGARRLRSTSTASAFSGETYSTRQRRRASSGTGPVARRSSDHRNAARVLPEPVGATTRVLSPLAIESQAPDWAGVGAAKAPENQSRVAGEKRSSTSTPMPPYCLVRPTVRVSTWCASHCKQALVRAWLRVRTLAPGVAMPYLMLGLGILFVLVAANAHAPRRGAVLLAPSFFIGWLTIEMAPHVLVTWAAATGLTAMSGGLEGWAGRTGFVLAVLGMAGVAATLAASRRTVVTLRDSGAPLDLDPEGAPRYPLLHLIVPPLCLIPRRGVRV